MPSKASLIIRCLNEERRIGNLLDRIACQSWANREVIVVDSGSADRTLEIARQHPVRIVSIDSKEFTFGRSLNRGCQAATGEFLVMASAHVLPRSECWIEELLEPFQNPKVALSYGRQVGASDSKFSEQQVFKRWFPAESNFDQPSPFCNNANAAVRRALWEKRPYDESLSGLEDLDWAQWAMGQGHAVAYNAKAEVAHIHDETPDKIRNRYMREAIAMKRILPDAHMNLLEFAATLSSNVLLDLLRAAWQRRLGRSFREIFMFRTMQYWGTYKGMNHRSPLTQDLIRQFYYPRGIALKKPAPRAGASAWTAPEKAG